MTLTETLNYFEEQNALLWTALSRQEQAVAEQRMQILALRAALREVQCG